MTNNNPNPQRSKTQRQKILRLLEQGYELTPMDAIRELGCTKLATRISELIYKEGHTEICKRRMAFLNEDGGVTRYMCYYIPQ